MNNYFKIAEALLAAEAVEQQASMMASEEWHAEKRLRAFKRKMAGREIEKAKAV
jgi:hypothetical protein